ncbi:MAG TPA: hypothetical protein VMU83_08610 [Hanamia sp.]|nr:hypothetical protein [Hanamia sp.]
MISVVVFFIAATILYWGLNGNKKKGSKEPELNIDVVNIGN